MRRSSLAALLIGCCATVLPGCGSDDSPTRVAPVVTTAGRPAHSGDPMAEGVDEAAIRRHVATRVGELGGSVDPEGVSITLLPGEAAPGVVAFLAFYDTPAGRSSLSGIVDDSGPNTFPVKAVGTLFDRWIAVGELPPAARVAEVVSFILSNGSSQMPLLTEADVARLPKPEWREVVRVPVEIEMKGRPGVEFWMDTQMGLVRKRVAAKAGGGAAVEDRPIAEVLKGR